MRYNMGGISGNATFFLFLLPCSTCILIPTWHIPHHCHWNYPALNPAVSFLHLGYICPETNSLPGMWAECQMVSWPCPSPHPQPSPPRGRNPGQADCCHHCCFLRTRFPQGLCFLVPDHWPWSSALNGATLKEDTRLNRLGKKIWFAEVRSLFLLMHVLLGHILFRQNHWLSKHWE